MQAAVQMCCESRHPEQGLLLLASPDRVWRLGSGHLLLLTKVFIIVKRA